MRCVAFILSLALVLGMEFGSKAARIEIGDIPTPIIGDQGPNGPDNNYVFPDAIDLSTAATVQGGSGDSLIWSYQIWTPPRFRRYLISGVVSLEPGDSPITPPAWKVIAGPGARDDDPAREDSRPDTITIRNIELAPMYFEPEDPGRFGILPEQTQSVALYASDGTTFSSATMFIHTDHGGADRLSGIGELVYGTSFTNSVEKFGFFAGGNVTSSYDPAAGALCMTTTAAGENLAMWSGSYGMLPLVKNSVYEIRAKINSSQATPGLVPYWDMIIGNFGYIDSAKRDQRDLRGMNLYGGTYLFLDNTGSANAAISSRNPMDFVIWWCPSPMLTPQWNDENDVNNGPFAPANARTKDALIEFRMLDVQSNTGTNSKDAFGTLCLDDLTIKRWDYSRLNLIQNEYYADQLTKGGLDWISNGGGNTRAMALLNVSVTFANNTVTIKPGGSGDMLAMVEPGDFEFDLIKNRSVVDNYPVQMTQHTIYRVQMELSAPTPADEAAPPDILFLGADTVTNELMKLSYVTLQGSHIGMPKSGNPQVYTVFFYSNNGTSPTNPDYFSRFRWRLTVGSNAGLGGQIEPNTGAITLHSVKVDQVEFK